MNESVMNLLLQRDQRRASLRKRYYCLNVTIICEPEERIAIEEHRLLNDPIYIAPDVAEHQQRAADAFEQADGRTLFDATGAKRHFGDYVTGLVHTFQSWRGLTVTVADALAGVTIECPHLRELVLCEAEITTNFDVLSVDVENAIAFASGREQLLTPENAPEEAGLPPAAWPHPHQWRLR